MRTMTRPLPPKLQALLTSWYAHDGDLGPSRRGGIRRLVSTRSGRPAGDEESVLPERWLALLEKLATASYKILDEDLDALREEGLSEGDIYDLVVTGALAAGEARMRRISELLPGEGQGCD